LVKYSLQVLTFGHKPGYEAQHDCLLTISVASFHSIERK
jgi:hypothetical protein